MLHFLRAMVSVLIIFINFSESMNDGEQRIFLTQRISLTFAKTGAAISGNIHSMQWQNKLSILEFNFNVGGREPEPKNITQQTDTQTDTQTDRHTDRQTDTHNRTHR
jgi:hypothetical protein